MGACATKPKAKDGEGVFRPAPEPVDDMVKNTEEVKVMEEEKKVDVHDIEKKEVIEKVVVEDEKPFFVVVKGAAPKVEVSSVMKAEEKSKVEEKPTVEIPKDEDQKPKAETPRGAAPVPESTTTGEAKESEEKTMEKKDVKSV